MISIISSLATVALLTSSATAGLVSGPCPNITTIAYNTSMSKSVSHYLLYMDNAVYSYLGLAEKILPAGVLPNMTCLNVGNFGYPKTFYTQEFVNQTNVFALKELYYDYTTGTQVVYDCIDSKKATAIVDYAQRILNVTIPNSTVATFTKLLKAAHFDVTFVLSDHLSISAANMTNMVKTVKKQLPAFSMFSLHAFNMTSCI